MDKEVNARGGEGRIWRGKMFTKGDYSMGDWGHGFWGSLGFAGRRVSSRVKRISSGELVCWGFWARGP